jgi:hypothetical protein
MRAQGVQRPFEPDYSTGLLHPEFKSAANLYLADFRKQATEQKVRWLKKTRFLRSELRHVGSFISELFCISFQI